MNGAIACSRRALRRAPATVVTSILTLGAPITAILATWSGKPSPNGEQWLGYAILAAALLIVATITRRGAATHVVASA